MERKNFIRQPEDFVCGNCGHWVRGTGYTNHCPQCLWSKHVDDIPGDRANSCGGMMEPTGLELKQGLPHQIIHKCQRCGESRKNKVTQGDNQDALTDLSH